MLDRVDTPLAQEIKAEIRAKGPLTFRDFMERALYAPGKGFYAKGPAIGTPEAAFSTSAKFDAFAFALARAIRDADRRAGETLRVVELGGGTGELAERILARLGEGREYVVVEASAGLRERQAARGVRAVARATELAPAPSIVIGNEVLDALPVRRVVGDGKGGLLEVHVALDARGDLVEKLGPLADPRAGERLAREGISLARGQVADVCVEIDDLVRDAARLVSRGYLVLIDYGDDAERVYAPERLNGTLKAFRAQRAVYDAFDAVGDTDLTADVDFTAVARAALDAGLVDAGRARQGPWLASLGIAEHPDASEVDALTSPSGLGSAFDVACFKTPGLPDAPGFVDDA